LSTQLGVGAIAADVSAALSWHHGNLPSAMVAPATLAVFKKYRRFMTVSGLHPAGAWEGKLNEFS
jgi:hypothetical protein